MIIAIFLLALLAFGLFLISTWQYDGWGIIITCIAGTCLALHAPLILMVEYQYGLALAERNAFELSLKNARENGSELERAAIFKEIAEWNKQLAKSKYENSTWLLDQYIDDRVMDLEPLK